MNILLKNKATPEDITDEIEIYSGHADRENSDAENFDEEN